MAQSLFDYMKETQRLIRDAGQKFIDPEDLRVYINRARREVAMRAQCCRIVTPITASIVSIDVPFGGSGYTNPAVAISQPDFPPGQGPAPNGQQAQAICSVVGGVITSVNVVNGGYGYFQPTAEIIDPTGNGAVLNVNLTKLNKVVQGQEVYKFSDIDLSAFPGLEVIYAVNSITIVYNNYRYALPQYSFSVYQAKIRQYPFQYQWVPTICSQYGRGAAGSIYMYPIASQPYQSEFDAYCLPANLESDNDFEAIPDPWTDAVAYWAAYLAYMELQNLNAARFMKNEFMEQMHRYSWAAQSGRQVNPYGRY